MLKKLLDVLHFVSGLGNLSYNAELCDEVIKRETARAEFLCEPDFKCLTIILQLLLF